MFGGESIHAGKIETGKFNARRTGFLPVQRQQIVRLANAGVLNDEPEVDDFQDDKEGEVAVKYVYNTSDDDLPDELDQAADEETVEPKGENGVHWI